MKIVLLVRLMNVIIICFLFPSPSIGSEVINSEMVYFPKGEFEMGSPTGQGKKNEHPKHKVYLNAFYLDKYEVTFSDFEFY